MAKQKKETNNQDSKTALKPKALANTNKNNKCLDALRIIVRLIIDDHDHFHILKSIYFSNLRLFNKIHVVKMFETGMGDKIKC